MTMMFDDTIKLYATPSDDDQHYSDEAEDDHDDLRQRFVEDDEEEEVTMTSDDDELGEDEDEKLPGTHAEDATIFTLPPSPVTGYDPATKPSELPVKNSASTNVATPIKAAAKKTASPAKKAAPAKAAPKKSDRKSVV